MAELKAKFPVDEVVVSLETSNVEGGKADDILECMICTNIVWDAKQCAGEGGCERLFCSDCIEDWLKHKKTCPGCRKQPLIPAKPSLVTRKWLSALFFNCKVCNSKFEYNKAGEHAQRCQRPKLACVLGCSPQLVYQGWAQIEDHLKNSCTLFPNTCRKCGDPRLRGAQHSCDVVLLRKINDQE